MLAYKVTINGREVATVGMKEDGVIFLKAIWMRLSDAEDLTFPSEGDARFTAHGLRTNCEDQDESLEWCHEQLSPGDKITLELVETDTVDQPARIRIITSDTSENGSQDGTSNGVVSITPQIPL